MVNSDPDFRIGADPGKGYVWSGKIMLVAILVLFVIVVFMVGFHLYARWYLIRLHRRRQLELRRIRRGGRRTHVVLHVDNQPPVSVPDSGLEKAVLNSLPVYVYSPKTEPAAECVVCLTEFEENEVVRNLPKCGHSFHIECIDMWFGSHSTCPLCRSPIEPVVNRDKTVVSESDKVDNEVEPEASSNGDVRTKRIEVPPRRIGLDDASAQTSTGNRLLSLKRILSMNIKPPVSGTTPRGAMDLDLESGLSELNQDSSQVR